MERFLESWLIGEAAVYGADLLASVTVSLRGRRDKIQDPSGKWKIALAL